MADDGKVTAFDIYAALDARYRKSGNGYWNQVTVRAPDGELRLDGVALDWSTGRMWVLGFEAKVSRSDWLRDSKFERYRRYCDALTVVCPKGMIARGEVPEGIGLMWYDPENSQLRFKRKPEYDMPGTDTTAVKDRLLELLTRGVRYEHGISRYGRFASARDFLDQQETMRGVGRALGSKMAMRLDELEMQVEPKHRRMVEAKAALFDRLADLLWDHGYRQFSPWGDPTGMDADARLAELDHALSDVVPRRALAEDLDRALDLLEGLRGSLDGDRQAGILSDRPSM